MLKFTSIFNSHIGGRWVEIFEFMLVVTDFGFLFRWHKRMDICLLLQVEVLKIYLSIFYIWLQGWWNWLRLNFLNIKIGKPRMRKNFFNATLGSEPRLLVFVQQLLNNIYKFIGVFQTVFLLIWEDDLGPLNLGQKQILVLVKEWSHTNTHLIYQDAKCPPINSKIMPRLQNHFRRKIFRCATIRPGHTSWIEHFRETEIDDFEIAVHVDQDVFEFEVSVDDAFSVEVAECQRNLHSIKLDLLFLKSSTSFKESIKFTTSYKWHHKK